MAKRNSATKKSGKKTVSEAKKKLDKKNKSKGKSGKTTKTKAQKEKERKAAEAKAKKNNSILTGASGIGKMSEDVTDVLSRELMQLESLQGQNPETGAGLSTTSDIPTYIDGYTNRVFGAPYQMINSVDYKFGDVNKHLGTEYMRDIILNSPILHIKPGRPYYTGGNSGTGLLQALKEMYFDSGNKESFTKTESLLESAAKSTLFKKGSKLQRRMFGFREDFYTYMQYVNYMLHSIAVFMNLTATGNTWPNGIVIDGEMQTFDSIDWSCYRFISGQEVLSPFEQLSAMADHTLIAKVTNTAKNAYKNIKKSLSKPKSNTKKNTKKKTTKTKNGKKVTKKNTKKSSKGSKKNTKKKSGSKQTSKNVKGNIGDVMANKVCSVLFMVEPVQFEDVLTNQTKDSMLETAADTAYTYGSEIAWITNSKADTGMVGKAADFLGKATEQANEFLSGLTEKATGGFATNLFHGAVGAINGQKMIYPKIYDSSNSESNYTFTVNLTTPYGDAYHYYTDVLVPLCHLICLAAPRMVTSNATTSPFIVQAFIPGMCTIELGIISSMTIDKNPNVNHVSVNGFPLDVKVTFTIQELYNSLSISPDNDPASFLFNETLNDYMANLAGLQPCIETYEQQRVNAFQNIEGYFAHGAKKAREDMANAVLLDGEDALNPFLGR